MRHNTLREKAEWFLGNLDLLIEDLDFEDNGVEVCLFFDTVDVSYGLLGLHSYEYDPVKGYEAQPHFSHPRILIQCLMAAGWLRPIEMLLPHQAEFLQGLNMDFGVGSHTTQSERHVIQFLDALGMSKGTVEEEIPLRSFSDKELLQYVRKRAGRAVDVFKAIESIKETWPARLVEWRKKDVLRLAGSVFEKTDYREFVGRRPFVCTRQTMEELRPRRYTANYSDAMAVALLADGMKSFKEGRSKRLPRFFVSTRIWKKVFEDPEVLARMSYENLAGDQSSVHRQPEYFLFRALFLSNTSSAECSGRPETLFGSPSELRELRKEIGGILRARKPFEADALRDIRIGNRKLDDLIDEIENFSFFENVWLPFSARNEAQKALRYLDHGSRQLAGKRFGRAVQRAILETKEELSANVEGYERFLGLWKTLQAKAIDFCDQIGETVADEGLVCRDLGLLRFGFPIEIGESIREVVAHFLRGRREAVTEALGRTIQAISGASRHDSDQERNMAIAAAVLWVLRMDKQIIEMMGANIDTARFSLQILAAAAMLRSQRQVERAKQITERLTRLWKKSDDEVVKGQLSCGLGYLFFRLWRAAGGKVLWREGPDPDVKLYGFDPKDFGREAIKYAESGCGCDAIRPLLKVYALNQYLYYMVETTEPEIYEEEMNSATRKLLNYRGDPDLWGYRYNDTLARRCHRLATKARDSTGWKAFMRDALRFSEAAVAASNGDDEVFNYKALLTMEYDKGFTSSQSYL
ncbi:MAG: hypothetical protein GY847_13260 [Proteobacteria bacterium]|nr:hypothetical protein [Pseudomonadota bacterium]